MEIYNFIKLVHPYIKGGIEVIGLLIIIYGVLKATFLFIKSGFNFASKEVKYELIKASALTLEFFLAAEIISTINFRDWKDLVEIAAIIVIRTIITFIIHWEIKGSFKSKESVLYENELENQAN